jgi:hypothetical protein
MTDTTNGWPGKPGVPLNPERGGWHWLSGVTERPAAFEWLAHKQAWLFHRAQPEAQAMPPHDFRLWTYLGPCLMPDEVQNLRDDLASAERERAHQHGRADRNAAEHAREQGKRETLAARVAELEGVLKDAAASVGEWGAYASQYLQEKWDLPGEVARYIAITKGKKDEPGES